MQSPIVWILGIMVRLVHLSDAKKKGKKEKKAVSDFESGFLELNLFV